MQRFPLAKALVFVALFFSVSACSHAQEAEKPSATIASPTYPESPDGLKRAIEDGLSVLQSGDAIKSDEYFAQFAIPDHAAWFARVFGDYEGVRMGAKYDELLPKLPGELRQDFQFAVTFQKIEIEGGEGPQSDPLDAAALAAMKQPVKLYIVDVMASEPKNPAASRLRARSETVGTFAYVQGAFRYVSTIVLMALSKAPDLRLQTGGDIPPAKLIHRVEPVYPADAKLAAIQGPVTLHVIVGKNGSVRMVSVVSGDPLLIDAAVEAVRHWKYEQSRLHNVPVEVDSTVTVNFTLN